MTSVSEIMLMHLPLADFAALVVAHHEVRAIPDYDAGSDSPISYRETEPVPTVSTVPARQWAEK